MIQGQGYFTKSFLFWAVFGAFVILCLVMMEIRFFLLPVDLQVTVIPDDAFYYLNLAKHFATKHLWTIDGGVSVTTGFHLFYAYILALIYLLFEPTTAGFVALGLGVTGITWFAALTVFFRFAVKERSIPMLVGMILVVSWDYFYLNIVNLMEWPFVIFFAVSYGLYYYQSARAGKFTWQTHAWLFLLGVLGSLARSDFGGMPLAIFASAALVYRLKPAAFHALAGLMGSVFGVACVFMHNTMITGGFLQSSARVKLFWKTTTLPISQVSLINVEPFLMVTVDPANATLIRNIIFPIQILILGLAGFLLFKRVSMYWKISMTKHNLVILAASFISLMIYSWLFTWNGEAQPWYSANLILPILTLIIFFIAWIVSWVGAGDTKRVVAIGLSGLVLILARNIYPGIQQWQPVWAHQGLMYQAGTYLAQNPLDGAIGAWNAGIVSYYQGGGVINLDGLVNEDIYPYITQNRIADYIDTRGIRYVVDFSSMFTDPVKMTRGGYFDQDFIDRLKVVKTFGDMQGYLQQYNLYEVLARQR